MAACPAQHYTASATPRGKHCHKQLHTCEQQQQPGRSLPAHGGASAHGCSNAGVAGSSASERAPAHGDAGTWSGADARAAAGRQQANVIVWRHMSDEWSGGAARTGRVPYAEFGKKNTKAELQVFWSGGGGSGAAHVQAPSSLCCALQAWAAPLRSGAPTPLTSVQQSPLGGCSEGGERRHPLLLCPALPPERPFLPPELGERENRAPPTLAWALLRWTLLKKYPLQFQCASRLL